MCDLTNHLKKKKCNTNKKTHTYETPQSKLTIHSHDQ